MPVDSLQTTKVQTMYERYHEGMVRLIQENDETLNTFDKVDKNKNGVLDFNEIITQRKKDRVWNIARGASWCVMALFNILIFRNNGMKWKRLAAGIGITSIAAAIGEFREAHKEKQVIEQMIQEHENATKLDMKS